MFYTYAEKQSNSFLGRWDLRQVAFDATHRYLYYSSSDLKETTTADVEPLPWGPDMQSRNRNSSANSPVIPTNEMTPFGTHRSICVTEAPVQPSKPHEIEWRRKVKVTNITFVAVEKQFNVKDPHLKEFDFYQVHIVGEDRPLATGEIPPAGPLLCPSAGLSGLPDRIKEDNEEYIRDPFFLKELYDSIRELFRQLKVERDRLAESGADMSAYDKNTQTIPSPRTTKNGKRREFTLRLRSEYECIRFYYTVRTVLGYDRLCVRMFRGLPPYDPRNNLTFATVPMTLWSNFKVLDDVVFYILVRGNILGRDSKGELNLSLKDAYLCITHDMVLILRHTGNIPKWIHLKDIKEFYYNHKCFQPYVAFIGEPGRAIDLIFIPQPPAYGEVAIAQFNPLVETLRIHRILYGTCFSSLTEARKVIHMSYTPEPSVRSFVEVYEDASGHRLNFDNFLFSSSAGISCPLPKVQLAEVWQQVNSVYRQNRIAMDNTVIPLYRNHTNDVTLTEDQLTHLEHRLARQRTSDNDIVGVSLSEAQLEAEGAPARSSRSRYRDPSSLSRSTRQVSSSTLGDSARGEATLPAEAPNVPREEFIEQNLQTPFIAADPLPADCSGSDNMSFASISSVQYAVANSRYLSREEFQELKDIGDDVIVEHHVLVSGNSPTSALEKKIQEVLSPTSMELNINAVVNESFSALQGSPLYQSAVDAMRQQTLQETTQDFES